MHSAVLDALSLPADNAFLLHVYILLHVYTLMRHVVSQLLRHVSYHVIAQEPMHPAAMMGQPSLIMSHKATACYC